MAKPLCSNDFDDEEHTEELYDMIYETVQEHLSKINKGIYWKCEVKNFGWRKISAKNMFRASSARELLQKILPNTDNTFCVYKNKMGITIKNKHHDNPSGDEEYLVTRTTESMYRTFHGII